MKGLIRTPYNVALNILLRSIQTKLIKNEVVRVIHRDINDQSKHWIDGK